jgi:AcrR family transcriptional regulator
MGQDQDREPDRRTARTRKAIFDAFIGLIFARRYAAIRTADVIEAAGIGRSTFYEHFRSKDEVLVAVIDPIFAPLADAAAGRGRAAALEVVLVHLWDQRAFGRVLFEPPLLAKLQRKLAGMIEARLAPDVDPDLASPRLVAAGAAAAQLAMLRLWLAGEVSCPPRVLARELMRGR